MLVPFRWFSSLSPLRKREFASVKKCVKNPEKCVRMHLFRTLNGRKKKNAFRRPENENYLLNYSLRIRKCDNNKRK